MIFTNARIFQGKEGFIKGSFTISGGIFKNIDPSCENIMSENRIDLNGMYVIPGLIDIHTHGCAGHDFSDGDLNGLHEIGKYLSQHGITSFAPTSMTLPYERLDKAFRTAKEYSDDHPSGCAKITGIHTKSRAGEM